METEKKKEKPASRHKKGEKGQFLNLLMEKKRGKIVSGAGEGKGFAGFRIRHEIAQKREKGRRDRGRIRNTKDERSPAPEIER